jgi:photosystem II stability/assembly factor-like uncharacterized protein
MQTLGLISAILITAAPAVLGAQWRLQASGTTASLRGVSAVSERVAWASGSAGTILLTTDGGQRWHRVPAPPGSDSLDFRDVRASPRPRPT